jgi:hypothetical protein
MYSAAMKLAGMHIKSAQKSIDFTTLMVVDEDMTYTIEYYLSPLPLSFEHKTCNPFTALYFSNIP